MLDFIISFSVRNKLIIALFILALLGYGAYEVTKLPIDAVPDITNNQVQVITVAPALGAPDIERLVTFPIEQVNANVPGLIEMRSFSRFGLSLITLVFEDDVDIYWARQQVSERLQQVQNDIPKGINPPTLAPVTTGLGEIYQYILRPAKGYEAAYGPTELRTIQDWIVRRQLLGVKGVADVSSFGGFLKQYEVAIDMAKLNSYQVSINDIFKCLEQNNQNTGGAYIEKGPTLLYIRSEGLVANTDDIKNIVVKNLGNGVPLLLGDVADVRIGHAVRYGAMGYNNDGEVAGAVVMMLKGANSGQVIKSVKEKVEQIKKTLPKGVVIEAFLDRTKMVNNAIGTVEKNLIEGSLIVIFILILFLGNIRAGLVVASVIPLAMLFAIIMMNLFGVSGNLMSLGALDFGLIVDGAVIIVEAILHKLTTSAKYKQILQVTQNDMDAEVEESSSRMMNSAVFGQLIILIVYLPIFSLQGIEGKMFKPMAQTVAFALVGAFLLSLTYIPMMSAVLLRYKSKAKKNYSEIVLHKVEVAFKHLLAKILHYPRLIITVTISVFIIAIYLFTTLGGEFIPQLEEGDFAIETKLLTGSNINTTVNLTQKASGLLLKSFPEVEKVVTKIGSSEIPTDPMPPEACDMIVTLKDKSKWTSAHSFPELAEKMSKVLSQIPGITTGFQFPVQMRFNELMTGARQDVVCKIFGENIDTLASYASKLGSILSGIEGAKDIYVEPISGVPQVVIQYNRKALAQYGLDITAINDAVNIAFAGRATGNVYEGERRFELVVRSAEEKRLSIDDIKNLLVNTPSGAKMPLSTFASIDIVEGANQIQREDAKRRIVTGFNVRGRDVQSIVKEVQQKAEQLRLPTGYYITYGGAFENLEAAKKRLSIAVPVSLLLIFLLLFFAFKSVKESILIYTAIPLSAIGGILALVMRGLPFSISAGIGFIALFGVAVLNGIVLLAEFNRLQASGVKNAVRIVLQGTSVRLRPVLMTASVASLGFLPMALSSGAGAEVQRPLATVVIGGLFSATFLTLFLLPVLYVITHRKKKMPSAKILSVLVMLFLLSYNTNGQVKLTLEAAQDYALQHNLSIQSASLQFKQSKQEIGTAFSVNNTNLQLETGHVNSAYLDNKFTISQSFQFPTVYLQTRKLLIEKTKERELNLREQQLLLKKAVAQAYYHVVYLYALNNLLFKELQLVDTFYQRATLRYKLGESNILEYNTAEILLKKLKLLKNENELSIEVAYNEIKWLLNTDENILIDSSHLKLNLLIDTNGFNTHPYIDILQHASSIAKYNLGINKHMLLPDIFAGYINQSFQGWQKVDNQERYYSINNKFGSYQLGIGIPLFWGAQKARIVSANTNYKVAQLENEYKKQKFYLDYNAQKKQYDNLISKVSEYENVLLRNAEVIISTAGLQYIKGEIHYLNYSILLQQAYDIYSQYYSAVSSLNTTIIELQYYLQK